MHRSVFVALAAAALVSLAGASVRADDGTQAEEAQIGERTYAELQASGELLPLTSELYAKLGPVAARIKAIADPQLGIPFHFVLVHQTDPNAFAVPGGNVYVTDSLFGFVRNADELAAVLCHETSHLIDHDALAADAEKQRTASVTEILGAMARLNRSRLGLGGENLAYRMENARYSRDVERRADNKGARTCAAAGFNPWGMIWLFHRFERGDTHGSLEVLSDHPSQEERIDALEDEFAASPEIFARFPPDIERATPLAMQGP